MFQQSLSFFVVSPEFSTCKHHSIHVVRMGPLTRLDVPHGAAPSVVGLALVLSGRTCGYLPSRPPAPPRDRPCVRECIPTSWAGKRQVVEGSRRYCHLSCIGRSLSRSKVRASAFPRTFCYIQSHSSFSTRIVLCFLKVGSIKTWLALELSMGMKAKIGIPIRE
ncbi:hypothetical protein LX32DRAFT_167937 [Colletotrichum zoysiae]|uniref:Uncharacterized protein n=1 Tax=Colletotrichum zoysiae TaxID=1216348 RepID=A0AAD9M801_9PEZI|nr:hypothetical protein LX32DRAFT_167937 [Colletotrichum zoysiae]